MENKKIAQKLVTILAALGAVPKKGWNNHQKYSYMREVDVLETLKEELVKHKMILLTSSRLSEVKHYDKGFLTTVETTHTFLDSESGESLTINSVGSGYDSTDKGSGKAITAAIKYALMKTFMISDEGADVENDGETVQKPVEPARTSFKKAPVVAVQNTPGPVTVPSTPAVGNSGTLTVPNGTTSGPIVLANETVTNTKRTFSKRPTTKPEPNFP